jgi:crotonobetainyl-CoA:carnitine CoA-transferase CaiB-like acyl-CoA transferase
VLADPHVRVRGMVEEYAHPQIGRFKGLRVPFRFTGFDDPAMTRPPLLGEHTDAVLQDRLGLSADQVAGLRAQRAI